MPRAAEKVTSMLGFFGGFLVETSPGLFTAGGCSARSMLTLCVSSAWSNDAF